MSQMRVTTEDLIAHLEEKIRNDECTNTEYGLYIDYQNLGEGVFRNEDNKYIVKRLKREVYESWD